MHLMNRMTLRVLATCLVSFFGLTGSWAIAAEQSNNASLEEAMLGALPEAIDAEKLPSMSARYTSRHEPSGAEILSAYVEISPKGLRVKDVSENGAHEMLQNFTEEHAWFVDHERSISHRLPLIEMPELGAASPGLVASFLTPNPCGILRAEEQSPGRWRGRRVTAFDCLDEFDEVVSIEFIDNIHNIVVYIRSRDGYIDELSGMTDRNFDDLHFLPPGDYRAVDKKEFLFGAPPLLPYSPSVNSKESR